MAHLSYTDPVVRRTLTDHRLNPVNEAITIEVLDDAGPGGACHNYLIGVKGTKTLDTTLIHFQEGPILEAGINGLTQEALLAVVIDRLRGFQSGKFSCKENAVALTHIETGLLWLQKRTIDRTARGVEGQNKA